MRTVELHNLSCSIIHTYNSLAELTFPLNSRRHFFTLCCT